MNKVDIYVNDFRLDVFNDEEISINLSVQNIQDISKVFTDFTQSFTVPATPNNNEILQFYFNPNITSSVITRRTRGGDEWQNVEINWEDWTTLWNAGGSSEVTTNTFDGRLRQEARIEINSLPFRTGVIQMESVQLKGTQPYAYTLTFYGDLVNMTDLFGEDYLYDLDFSAYDLNYTDDNVFDGLTTDDFGELFFPLMSPVKNWYYNSDSSDDNASNIAANGAATAHGINYFELKPALKVSAILDAMEAKYGITFTGSFLSSVPFTDLSLWLHRTEGYLYQSTTPINWQLIDFNRTTGGGTEFDLATETWNVVDTDLYQLDLTITNADSAYEIGLFQNSQQVGIISSAAHASSSVTHTFVGVGFYAGDAVQLFIRPEAPVSFNYRVDNYQAVDDTTTTKRFEVDQTGLATYSFTMIVSDLMPEIKVKDFLAGIVKMYNLVIVPNSQTSFLLQPLSDWYAAGNDKDYTDNFDITEYAINRPSLYREIEFKYQETDQILGFQYRKTNNTGFGDLRAFFDFDGDTLNIQVPFECPLFERLTNQTGGALTDVLVYKSITNEANEDGTFNPYLGAPVLFYGYFDDYDISGTAVNFVDADGINERTVNGCWYANTSNRYSSAGASRSICFGADIDPYHLQSVSRSLYYDYWTNYITDLYAKSRRIYQISAVLPLGKILTLNLQNAVVWNNQKYQINSAQINMTTGKATFELLNVV